MATPSQPTADPAAPLVGLGTAQLQIKTASANNYDTHGLGLLAFNGALLAANVAAQNVLEKLWWMSLIGLFVSVLMCVRVLVTRDVDVGERLSTAREKWGGLTEPEINALLVDSLIQALAQVDGRIADKRKAVGLALIALAAAGFLAAISTIVS